MATDTEPTDDLPEGEPPADEPLPPRPRPRPQPNFWWSLLACVGLLVVQTIGFLVVWLGVWLGWCAVAGGNFGTNAQEDLNGLQEAITRQPTDSGTPPPVMPQRMAVGMIAGAVGGNVFMFAYAWLLARLVFGQGWTRTVAFRRPSLWQLLIAMGIFLPGMMYTLEGLDTLVRSVTGWRNGNYDWMVSALTNSPLWLGLLAIAIGPGIVEELFCRGFLGRGLVGRHGWIFGVFLTSLLFGLLHLEPVHVLMTMLMGIGLHFTLATSRSLWVPILLHAVNNGVWAVTSTLPTTTDSTSPLILALRFGSGVVLLALGVWAMWSCRAKVVPVDDSDDRWRPRFPTVATPPPDSGLTTTEGRPNLLPLILAALPLAGLVCSLFVR